MLEGAVELVASLCFYEVKVELGWTGRTCGLAEGSKLECLNFMV